MISEIKWLIYVTLKKQKSKLQICIIFCLYFFICTQNLFHQFFSCYSLLSFSCMFYVTISRFCMIHAKTVLAKMFCSVFSLFPFSNLQLYIYGKWSFEKKKFIQRSYSCCRYLTEHWWVLIWCILFTLSFFFFFCSFKKQLSPKYDHQ